jgi:hypothetical protein
VGKQNFGKRAVTLAVSSALVSVGIVGISGSAASADANIRFGCTAHGDESSPYTDVTETQGNCDYVQARTYTYNGGGSTTTTYGGQGYSYSIAYKASSGSYSGGAGRLNYNGTWSSWAEL